MCVLLSQGVGSFLKEVQRHCNQHGRLTSQQDCRLPGSSNLRFKFSWEGGARRTAREVHLECEWMFVRKEISTFLKQSCTGTYYAFVFHSLRYEPVPAVQIKTIESSCRLICKCRPRQSSCARCTTQQAFLKALYLCVSVTHLQPSPASKASMRTERTATFRHRNNFDTRRVFVTNLH